MKPTQQGEHIRNRHGAEKDVFDDSDSKEAGAHLKEGQTIHTKAKIRTMVNGLCITNKKATV